MFSLDFLKGPLMNAAGLKPPMPGPSTTTPKPQMSGMFGKAGKMFAQLPPADAGQPETMPQMAPPSFDPFSARMPPPTRAAESRVEDVPVPALPGRTGGPRPFDPQTKAEFDYVMSKIPRTAEGGERKPTFGERFKSSLLPALLGTVQGINASPRDPLAGAIGGAGAGFAGGMIDPISARQYEWNQMYKPEMDVQEQHQDQLADGKRKADESLVNLEARRAGIDYTRAQTDAMRVNNQANHAYKQSQIALNEARAKALETGKPQIRDVVDENGQIRTYQVHGDGSMLELGGSARAAMNTENNTTRQTIADNRNTTQATIADKNAAAAMDRVVYKDRGQTGRAAIAQAGRTTGKPGGAGGARPAASVGGKRSRQAWIEAAVAAGHSRADAEAFADRKGLK